MKITMRAQLATYSVTELKHLRRLAYKELVSRKPVKQKQITQKKLPNNEQPRIWTLYVLELNDNKYYVGITSKTVQKRLTEHILGIGAAWTKIYKPIAIINTESLGYMTKSEAETLENAKTFEMIKMHGRDNVRGGVACQVFQDNNFDTALRLFTK